MRAVNLIPDDQRRGAGGTTGRSGGVAFAVIGVLAGLVALVAVYTMTSSTISTRESQLKTLKQQVLDSQTANAQLAKYSALAAQRKARVDTVTQIADTRFDWAHAMNEIPRVLPTNTWLEEMDGTLSPTATSGSTAPAGPQIEIKGCTTGQIPVANVMSALSRMDGVIDVDLISSDKADTVSAGSESSDCRVKDSYPLFDLRVTYEVPGGDRQTGTDNVNVAASLATTPTVTATPPEPVTQSTSAGAQG